MNRTIRDIFSSLVLLLAVALASPKAGAQENTVLDGPSVKVDSMRTPLPKSFFMMSTIVPTTGMYDILSVPDGADFKEQMAFFADALAQQNVISSIQASLLPDLKAVQVRPWMIPVAIVAGLTLCPPFLIPDGYVPMFNHSNPYALIKIPGWAPQENPTSPEVIPQAIRLVYNDKTGKYEQEMVPWEEFQMQTYFGKNGQFNNQALPVVRMNSFERQLFQSMGM